MYEQIQDEMINHLNELGIELSKKQFEEIVAIIQEELEDLMEEKIENFTKYI